MPSKYSGPDHRRMSAQFKQIENEAGQIMVWHHFISGSTGIDVVGEGTILHYNSTTITGLVKSIPDKPEMAEMYKPGGMLTVGQYRLAAREPIARDDKITWNDVEFVVQSDPLIDAYTNRRYFLIRRVEE